MSLEIAGVPVVAEEDKTTNSDEEKFNNIADPRVRAKVRMLKAAFEDDDINYLKDVLRVCKGCVDTAGNLLFGNLPDEVEATVKRLMKNYPTASEMHAQAVVIEARNNFDDASQRLEEQLRTGKPSDYINYVRLSSSGFPSPPKAQGKSSTETRHVNGVVQGFIYRHDSTYTKTNGESSKSGNWVDPLKKSNPAIQNQKGTQEELELKEEEEDDEEPSLFLTSPKGKKKGQLEDEPSASEDSFDVMADRLHQLFGGRVKLDECENTLQCCDNDITEAFKMLDGDYNLLVEDDDDDDEDDDELIEVGSRLHGKVRRPDSGVSGLDGRDRGREKIHKEAASGRGKKRLATSPDNLTTSKKPRVASPAREIPDEGKQVEFDSDLGLEPADDWMAKYYPDGRKACLLLGPNEFRQETLPRRLLYENSSFFKAIYDQQERDEELDETVNLPDVDPDVFGLAIQTLVTKNFTLPMDPSRSQSTDIGIIIELVILSSKLGFPIPNDPVAYELRRILKKNRPALRSSHIRRAYGDGVPEDSLIRVVFCQAIVRAYMRSAKIFRGVDLPKHANYDSEEEEGMTAARRAAYAPAFRYQRAFDSIRAFRNDLLGVQDEVLRSPIERETEKKRGKTPAIVENFYQDPLDEDEALEWRM